MSARLLLRLHLDIMGRYGSKLTTMLVEPKVATLEAFADLINDDQFVVVDHWSDRNGELTKLGPVVLNTNTIKKCREWKQRDEPTPVNTEEAD